MHTKDAAGIANSVDPDQTTPPLGAVCSSTRSSRIWVCTVCPDLSIRKLRIITETLFIWFSLGQLCLQFNTWLSAFIAALLSASQFDASQFSPDESLLSQSSDFSFLITFTSPCMKFCSISNDLDVTRTSSDSSWPYLAHLNQRLTQTKDLTHLSQRLNKVRNRPW